MCVKGNKFKVPVKRTNGEKVRTDAREIWYLLIIFLSVVFPRLIWLSHVLPGFSP